LASILVVDAEPLVRDTLRLLLESAGHEVIEAADGSEAAALYLAARPALVISDVVWPARGGRDTIDELRSLDPGVRIIAMSGGGDTGAGEDLDSALQRGASAVLAKPFGRTALLDLVRRLLAEA
jgi:CheY-like chemotaxis protein